jgi:transmembrane sensor
MNTMTLSEAKTLLFAHFANKTTPLQRRSIEEWLHDEVNQEQFYGWLVEWENQLPIYQPDAEAPLQRFTTYMTNNPDSNGNEDESGAETELPVPSPWSRFRLMAAASVLLLLTLAGWVNRNRILYQSYRTAYGETRTIHLPDGSTVMLNAHSTLRLPRFGFGNRSREVQLAGEAFFSVQHRADNQKFIVRTTNGFDVIVYGTEFNVSTYAHRANVMLSRGQVQVDYSVGATRKQLMLEPGDLVSLNQPSSPKLTRHVQPQVYSAWKEHRFVFNDMTLLEFGQLLNDTYVLRVELSDDLARRTLVGSFQADSADELLRIVSELLNLNVIRQTNFILLSEREPTERH